MEVKPMNLTGVSHNPLTGMAREESPADKYRKAAEVKFMKKMQSYQIKAAERKENEYYINKRAENFVFSHYPSSKGYGDFTTAFDRQKFNPGSRSKMLKIWKEQVGGGLQQFNQWYEMSKQAEQKALVNSLTRDPRKYLTQESYENAVSDWYNGLSDDTRMNLINNSSPELMNIINSVVDPSKDMKWETIKQQFEDDKWGYITGASALAFASFMALRKGKFPSWLSKSGIIKSGALLDDNFLKQSMLDGSKIPAKRVDDMLKRKMITKAQADALKAGERVVPDVYMKNMPKRGQQMNMFDDVVQSTSNNIRMAQRDINKYVKDKMLTQAQGDQLKGVLDDMVRNGETITPNNLLRKLQAGGKKFEGLTTALDKGQKVMKGFGPIKNPGIILGMAVAGTAYLGVSQLAEMAGMDENDASAAGLTAAIPSQAYPIYYRKIKDVLQKKGSAYVMKKILEKGSWKLAARIAGSTLLSGSGVGAVVGFGLLGWELKNIYDLLTEEE